MEKFNYFEIEQAARVGIKDLPSLTDGQFSQIGNRDNSELSVPESSRRGDTSGGVMIVVEKAGKVWSANPMWQIDTRHNGLPFGV